jgi:hypothetical protein
MVDGRALRIYKDADAARYATSSSSSSASGSSGSYSYTGGGDDGAVATLLLYETVFLRPGGDKFAHEFGPKHARFVMQIISPQCTWFIAGEDEPTFKKWLQAVVACMDPQAVRACARAERSGAVRCVRVRACVRACVRYVKYARTCVRACVCMCVRVCVCACVRVV